MARAIAIVLALGGLCWGALLLGVFGPVVLVPFQPFGIGYLVTVGYIWRALFTPTETTRKRIWWFSLVVQGCWLLIGVSDDFFRQEPRLTLPTAWWIMATIGSIVALLSEEPDEVENKVISPNNGE